jgi:haloacetate dehalogenase
MAENLSVAPIERCGHLAQEEQPEAVNRLLLDFDGRAGLTVKRIRQERPMSVEMRQEKVFLTGQCSIRID